MIAEGSYPGGKAAAEGTELGVGRIAVGPGALASGVDAVGDGAPDVGGSAGAGAVGDAEGDPPASVVGRGAAGAPTARFPANGVGDVASSEAGLAGAPHATNSATATARTLLALRTAIICNSPLPILRCLNVAQFPINGQPIRRSPRMKMGAPPRREAPLGRLTAHRPLASSHKWHSTERQLKQPRTGGRHGTQSCQGR